MRAGTFALFVLVACGPPAPPKPPGGVGGGGGDPDDTACGACVLYDCVEDDDPDVADADACEAAAEDLGCDDWEWSDC